MHLSLADNCLHNSYLRTSSLLGTSQFSFCFHTGRARLNDQHKRSFSVPKFVEVQNMLEWAEKSIDHHDQPTNTEAFVYPGEK